MKVIVLNDHISFKQLSLKLIFNKNHLLIYWQKNRFGRSIIGGLNQPTKNNTFLIQDIFELPVYHVNMTNFLVLDYTTYL